MRAIYEIRPPAWGETLAVLQSVSLPDGPERVRARVVDVEGERVTVDFPALDGETSAEQLLATCVAGEWADRGDVESCRLVEVEWPDGLPGPAFPAAAGVSIGAIVKPALGLTPGEAAAVAAELAAGGAVLVKDDELQRSSPERVRAINDAIPGARPLRRQRDRRRRRRDRRGRSAGADGERVPRRARLDRAAAGVRPADLRPSRRLGLPAPGRPRLGLGARARGADAAARRRLRPGRVVLAAHVRHRRRGAGADRGCPAGDGGDRRRRRSRERPRAARASRNARRRDAPARLGRVRASRRRARRGRGRGRRRSG